MISEEDSNRVVYCYNSNSCDTRTYVGGGKYICAHNNLSVLRYDLAIQWNYEKNIRTPNMFSLGSSYVAWWICHINPCGCHHFDARIADRVRGAGACPYCIGKRTCIHLSIVTTHPLIANQWDYVKNAHMNIEEISYGSGKYCWWICPINPCGCHHWGATVADRTTGYGCPYCSNNKTCIHKSIVTTHPLIASQWDYERNVGINIEEISYGSNIYCWWICPIMPCGCHHWQAPTYSRCIDNKGCSYCANQRTCIHSSIVTTYPLIASQWDYGRNIGVNIAEVNPGSNNRYWWICPINPCGCHIWDAPVYSRTVCGYGCPFCCSLRICPHNSLHGTHPELMIEWDYQNNTVYPWTLAPCSNVLRNWICKVKPVHHWPATPSNRVSRKSGCPICVKSRGYSMAQMEWLQRIEREEGITIRHILSDTGEFKIAGINKNGRAGKVDGYCQETNTVYEYHGDYRHGNPNVFPSDSINPSNHKSYGELYRKTLERDDKIRQLGYNLIVEWESTIELIITYNPSIDFTQIVEVKEPGFVIEII